MEGGGDDGGDYASAHYDGVALVYAPGVPYSH